MSLSKPEFTKDCVQKLALATLGMICTLTIVMVVFFDGNPAKCKVPKWVSLHYIEDGSPLFVNVDKITQVVSLRPFDPKTDKVIPTAEPTTRVDMGENFVVVKEKVSTLKKKLCVD